MLGRELVARIRQGGGEVTALTRAELDVTDPSAVGAALRRARPGVVVNCAAWTAVDQAESHEAEALAVNGSAVAVLAAACAEAGARLIQPSTDYVFDGRASRPYAEDAPTGPVSAYGRTKLAGEQAVLRDLPGHGYVLRTAWLYGPGGRNFVSTMLRLEGQQPTVSVVTDQHGQPTSTAVVADRILALAAASARPGIYHATCSGQTTWHGLACEVFRLAGADPGRVRAVPSTDVSRPAPRPAYSVLAHGGWARAGLEPPPDWRSALAAALPALRRDLAGHDQAGQEERAASTITPARQ
jgi:dTDP-4-dehydrorhamnose reductase